MKVDVDNCVQKILINQLRGAMKIANLQKSGEEAILKNTATKKLMTYEMKEEYAN